MMYDVSQLLSRSPQSTRSRVTSTPTRQSPMRLLSPTKSQATSSRTRQTSPRKSPAKRSIFDAMSTQSVHFTPERTRQPPRAWERRPATPYVPRDDKQKIWKRVPLGEIGIEPNRPANISRREQEAKMDYVRVVKKLKVGHGSDDEDKENVSLDVKIDCDNADVKRNPCLDSRFVSMKMEEDDIVGSPKKKLRAFPSECESTQQQEEHEEHDDLAETEDEDDMYGERSENSVEQNEFEEQAAPNEQQESVREITLVEDVQLAANTTDVSLTQNTCTDDSASSNSTTDASECEQEVTASHGPDGSSLDTTSGSVTESEILSSNNIPITESSEQKPDMLEPELPENTLSNNQEMLPHPVEASTGESVSSCEQQRNDEMEVDNIDQTSGSEEPRSSSPPTILAENVVIDELESRNASKADTSMVDQTDPSNDQQGEGGSNLQDVQESAPRRISDDEAAFLRNFVSNSKAERAAREKKAQDTLIDESNNQAEETVDGTTDLHESFEEAAQVTQGTPILEPSATVSAEIVTSSPLRRSKRAAITSIPRPQILPNAIQLKRANGNEFIFTANKACSVANLAVVTRSNTKRNKGSALTVPERLEQLVAGDKAIDENDEAAQIDPETSDNLAGENTSKPMTTKKRKRDGKDGVTRAKKVLRWNDEKLVSYQEAKRFLDEPDEIDDSSQESNLTHEAETEPDKHVKLTLTLTSSGTGKSSSKDEKDNSNSTPQSKVRRVRRGTSGTVNGTPGPKTRSRRTTNDDDRDLNTDIPIDDQGALEDSTAAAAAINQLAATAEVSKSIATKRSRMPMPVASSLGTRRGAAASASIRSGSIAMRAAAAAAAGPTTESKKVKETSKSQVPKNDAKGGDLLGKRRLRVRS